MVFVAAIALAVQVHVRKSGIGTMETFPETFPRTTVGVVAPEMDSDKYLDSIKTALHFKTA